MNPFESIQNVVGQFSPQQRQQWMGARQIPQMTPQQNQQQMMGLGPQVASPAQEAAQAAPQTGMFAKFNNHLQDNKSAMMAMSAGMMGSPGQPGSIGQGFQNYAAGGQLDDQRREKEAGETATEAFLKKRGYGAEDIAFYKTNPAAMAQALKPANPGTTDMRNFEYGQGNPAFAKYLDEHKEGETNIYTGDGQLPSDADLRKKLQQGEGEVWAEALSQRNTSAALSQDLEMLDELGSMAVQGPVMGRLSQAFPGFDSAGAAFQSIVKRVAPAMRAPGSGSTSDIEYQGFLDALPALSNKPEANAMITQLLREKAALNIERGDVVDAFSDNRMTHQEARARMKEINERSILTPEMRQLLGAMAPTDVDPTDELLDLYGVNQ